MTFYEYEARMYAFNLQQIDKDENMHMQAWLHQQAKATKKKGKHGEESVYDGFKDFFDKDTLIKSVEDQVAGEEKITPKMKSLAKAARIANERR